MISTIESIYIDLIYIGSIVRIDIPFRTKPTVVVNVTDLCLGTLCLSDCTGYEIKKLFEASFSHFHGAGFGSIYPALNKLAEQGMVEVRTETSDGRPDRKRYSITETGRKTFFDSLATAKPTEQMRSDFLVILFFAHLMPTDRLRTVLEQVEAAYRKKLDYLNAIVDMDCHSEGVRLSIKIGIASIGARLETLQQHKDRLLTKHKEPPSCDLSSL